MKQPALPPDDPRAQALDALAHIALDCGLEEAEKWGQRCFMAEGGNILILGYRTDRAELGFFKGALLDDPDGRLTFAGPNSRSAKYWGFADAAAVHADETVLRGFIAQAVDNERKGLKVEKPKGELELIAEIQEMLDADPELSEAFEELTPGRKRAYNIIVGGAKKSATRTRRFEGYRDRVMAGKGPQDCICGLSKRMPRCDGSHKQLG